LLRFVAARRRELRALVLLLVAVSGWQAHMTSWTVVLMCSCAGSEGGDEGISWSSAGEGVGSTVEGGGDPGGGGGSGSGGGGDGGSVGVGASVDGDGGGGAGDAGPERDVASCCCWRSSEPPSGRSAGAPSRLTPSLSTAARKPTAVSASTNHHGDREEVRRCWLTSWYSPGLNTTIAGGRPRDAELAAPGRRLLDEVICVRPPGRFLGQLVAVVTACFCNSGLHVWL